MSINIKSYRNLPIEEVLVKLKKEAKFDLISFYKEQLDANYQTNPYQPLVSDKKRMQHLGEQLMELANQLPDLSAASSSSSGSKWQQSIDELQFEQSKSDVKHIEFYNGVGISYLAEELLALTKRVEQLEAHYQKMEIIKEQQIVSTEKEAELLGLLEKRQAKIEELEASNQMNQQERNQLEATVQKQEKLIYELQPSIESLIEQDVDQIKNSLAKVSFEQIIETAKNEFGIFELQNFENEFAKVCQLITNKIKQL